MVDEKIRTLTEETVRSQLKVWDDEIDHLDARTDIILAQVEERYYSLLRSLRQKELAVRNCLNELGSADEQQWEVIRGELAKSTGDLKAALGEAIEEIEPTHS
jgi:hypothetical protein